MASTYNINTDIREALAMAEGLTNYVRGDQVYGSASGGFFSKMPSLTIGALLMRLRRLNAMRDTMTKQQEVDLDRAVELYMDTRKEWTHHYEEKMQQEAHSRIDAMQSFFKECADSAANCGNVYRPELLRRTIVQEVLDEMNEMNLDDPDLLAKIKAADGKLRGFLSEDTFQWSDELAEFYPQTTYWWLYQKPPKPTES